MNLKVQDHYHATVIALGGKFLGSIHGAAYQQAIDDLGAQGKIQVVVDLAQAELMDSTGIGLLIDSLTTLRRAGGDIRLACLKTRVRNVFLMTRLLGPVFEDYDTLDAALESYRDQPLPEHA